jgi:hypothetical protein
MSWTVHKQYKCNWMFYASCLVYVMFFQHQVCAAIIWLFFTTLSTCLSMSTEWHQEYTSMQYHMLAVSWSDDPEHPNPTISMLYRTSARTTRCLEPLLMNMVPCTPGQIRVAKLRVPILMHLLTPEWEVVQEQVRHNRTLRSLGVSYNVSVDD